jgi:CRISPR-associated protein Csd1
MILQALYRYYDILSKDPESGIAPPGYSTVEVSFALELSSQGKLLNMIPLFELVQRGSKLDEKPKRMIVPEQFKHTNKVSAFFLCDNSTYVLGISDREAEYGIKRFEAFRKFNKELLAKANCEPARATIAFLNGYDPHTAKEHPEISHYWDTLLKGGRLVFMFNGDYIHQNTEVINAWEVYKAGGEAILGQCLITGDVAPIARLHPPLQGVKNANSTGAALVSFNARAYESYNRVDAQGLNSPVSEKAAIAYSKVLNYLLSRANPNKKFYLGDTTVVYWAESEKKEYANAFASLIEPEYIEDQPDEQEGRKKAEGRMKEAAEKVRLVQALDASRLTEGLDKDTRFYVLGLAPNAARIAVRFFLSDPFGKIVERIMRHYDDLKIVKEYNDQPTYITIRQILNETVSKKSQDKDASPLMAGAVLRAILSGAPYPAALYYAIVNRIRADMDDAQARIRKINYVRAAVLKAFLIRKYRNQSNNPYQEVLTMPLNEQSTIPAYLLGRLFAVLEKAQQEAIGEMNASIKDRYFTSACASPASVFPVLLRLSQHHISKAEYGYANDRRIQDILNLLDVEKNPIPARLTLDEQGVFILGYYHQRAAFYMPKNTNPAEATSSDTE